MSVVMQTQSLAIFCFRWAARSSAAYFGLRFVLAVPLAMVSGGQVLSWMHVLLLGSLALFAIGSVAVLWSAYVVVSGRRAYEKAFMSGLLFCLAGCGFMFVDWLSRLEIDKPVLLLAYGDVLYVGLVLLTLLATGYGVVWLYVLGREKNIAQQTWWMGWLGLGGLLLDWITPSSWLNEYGMPITFVLLIGLGWSYLLSQLVIVMERGEDIPVSPIKSPLD